VKAITNFLGYGVTKNYDNMQNGNPRPKKEQSKQSKTLQANKSKPAK
jgi:hypothetical protein